MLQGGACIGCIGCNFFAIVAIIAIVAIFAILQFCNLIDEWPYEVAMVAISVAIVAI